MLLLLQIAIVVALIIDAVVHLRLAANYELAAPGGIGEGTLFRAESVAALAVAVLIVFRGTSRSSYLCSLVVAGSAVAAVVLFTYVDVPAIGPIPSMYEPVWYFEKSLSAVAEGVGAALSAAAIAVATRR